MLRPIYSSHLMKHVSIFSCSCTSYEYIIMYLYKVARSLQLTYDLGDREVLFTQPIL